MKNRFLALVALVAYLGEDIINMFYDLGVDGTKVNLQGKFDSSLVSLLQSKLGAKFTITHSGYVGFEDMVTIPVVSDTEETKTFKLRITLT